MNLIRIFVKRPVLTTMLLFAFVVLGIFSYRRMVIELMPNIEFPFVMVTTVYPGASPGEVESQVTRKIEDVVSTIANVKNLQSVSRENLSQVFIEFELETDVDLDAIDVKDKVDAIQIEMPDDAEKSVITKFDISAFPIMELAVSAPRPLEEIYRVTDKVIRERLSRIDGVADVSITGKREREIRVEIAPERLRAYGLSLLDVVGVIAAGNLNVPAGHITRGASEITLRMTGEVASPAELAEFRLPLVSGGTIPLSEVANILDTTEELRESSTYNGQAVIGLSISKRSDGNTVLVGRQVYRALDELESMLDPDIEINISSNSASFVEDAVHDVLTNIGIGIMLTALLLFIFLHNWRQTLVAALSMPVSVVATFLLMDSSGFTLNVMSLMALGISIGTLVTNSIVIIENISRLVHDGMDPHEAAVKGAGQVAVA
ncbi:MAG: efflux RND transporter permease subunit, partial [Candidatus Krumholzibacteria bacterium]|nr:efflux RND transporter permease subunit [Candidatus Krumholzibacteria bacterium]